MTRTLPTWFDDAKFGIFVHWTAAAVPAFAPVGPSPFEIAETQGWEAAFAESPYVEWYLNSLNIEGSSVAAYHAEHHPDTPYEQFVAEFLAAQLGWQPGPWADLFAAAGAKYVVLVTKHHDGVLLWPSATPNPFREHWAATRDVVGDLAAAVRSRGMRFGTYYSGGLDWTFGGLPITDLGSMLRAVLQTDEYLAYAEAHWRELIDRYEPSVLWNDIGYPHQADLAALQDHYYARVPDGVVNDRFRWAAPESEVHADFLTPEYSTVAPADGRKWESTRGMGSSFGYNRVEVAEDYLSIAELVRLVVDVTARGGNLLLNVGPTGEGRVPWAQAERLLGLGWWLAVNGRAIYGTRPWDSEVSRSAGDEHPLGAVMAQARLDDAMTSEGLDVRFTAGRGEDSGSLFAVILGVPTSARIELPVPVTLRPDVTVTQLGHDQPLGWTQLAPDRLQVDLADGPTAAATGPALTLHLRR